jgi:hypothetical protein
LASSSIRDKGEFKPVFLCHLLRAGYKAAFDKCDLVLPADKKNGGTPGAIVVALDKNRRYFFFDTFGNTRIRKLIFRCFDVISEKIKKRRASSYKQLKEALRTKRVVIPEGLIGPLKDMCHTALGEIPTHDSYKAIVAYMEALRPRDEERDEPASIDDQLDVYSDKIHRRDRDEQDSTDRS